MHETELWITKFFNDYLAGAGNALTGIVGMAPEARPWANFITMQLLVALIIIVLFAILKPRLSPDRPGKLQHTFELVYDFLHEQAEALGIKRDMTGREAVERMLAASKPA